MGRAERIYQRGLALFAALYLAAHLVAASGCWEPVPVEAAVAAAEGR